MRAQRKAKSSSAKVETAFEISTAEARGAGVPAQHLQESNAQAASETVVVPSFNTPSTITHAATKGASLPKGFFDSRQADAEAHGEKITEKDKDAEFNRFQAEMDAQIKKQAEAEALEADQATARLDAEEEYDIR